MGEGRGARLGREASEERDVSLWLGRYVSLALALALGRWRRGGRLGRKVGQEGRIGDSQGRDGVGAGWSVIGDGVEGDGTVAAGCGLRVSRWLRRGRCGKRGEVSERKEMFLKKWSGGAYYGGWGYGTGSEAEFLERWCMRGRGCLGRRKGSDDWVAFGMKRGAFFGRTCGGLEACKLVER